MRICFLASSLIVVAAFCSIEALRFQYNEMLLQSIRTRNSATSPIATSLQSKSKSSLTPSLFNMLIPVVLSSLIQLLNPISAYALDSPTLPVPVYFGVGCFWHVQHELVSAEQKILSRTDDQITSRTGYAGGTKSFIDKTGRDIVCYHNIQGLGDYGRLGYGEVVQVTLPSADPDIYRKFSEEYFSLFGADRERPDKGDVGPEYRSLVGLPGGLTGGNPLVEQLKKAAADKGITLAEGKGDDADTLGKKLIWVMDSDKFPFRQAEVYHQFHDGFMPGEQYPQSYNSLVIGAFKRGAIELTGCPDRAIPL